VDIPAPGGHLDPMGAGSVNPIQAKRHRPNSTMASQILSNRASRVGDQTMAWFIWLRAT
jgi:hypothetical protein